MSDDISTNRAKAALDILTRWGGIDGAHHKDWVMDQAVRALCGVPNGPEGYPGTAENDEYWQHVRNSCADDGVADVYEWSTGIAP